jgi:hypothetical protein
LAAGSGLPCDTSAGLLRGSVPSVTLEPYRPPDRIFAAIPESRENLRSTEIDAHKLSLDFAFFTPQSTYTAPTWKNPDEQLIETCPIITTTPNALVADVHARHSA